METENKYLETGSSPYYLNQNNTAIEYSSQETSNPTYGFLETINNNTIVENESEIDKPQIEQELIIIK